MNIPPLHVGRGEHLNGLTLFPIWHDESVVGEVLAANENTVLITELEDPEIERLRVTSTSRAPILLLDGDVLVGGKQDRMLVGSTLLKPGRTLEIQVRCVEHDRWDNGHRHTAGTRRATSYVRGRDDQNEVWRRVRSEPQNVGVRTAPGSFKQLPGQSGVLIGISGRPVVSELFANHRMLASYWSLIVEAAATEAAGKQSRATTGHTARSFIRRVDKLALQTQVGKDGASISARDGKLELRGLLNDSHLLQASIINHQEVSV